jgi:hypothetical protein
MKKKGKTGHALLAIMVVLILAGCPQEVETPSDDAGLSSITINDVSVQVPEGIDRDTWLPDGFPVSSMDVTEALFPANAFVGAEEELAALVTASPAGSGADIWFFKSSSNLKPDPNDAAWTKDTSFTFKDKDFLYIQVTSVDKYAQNYYRVRINKVSNETGLLALTIGSASVGFTNVAGANNIASVTPVEKTLIFGVDNINVPVDTVTKDSLATVQYGVLKVGNTAAEPQWNDGSSFIFDEGDRLYAKVTPSDAGASPKYYGVLIHTTLRVRSVNIGGTNQNITAHGGSVLADVGPVDVSRITQTITNVLSVAASAGVTVEYDLTAGGTPSFKALTGTIPGNYTDGTVLYLRTSAEGFVTTYYKFNIAVKSNDRSISAITIGGTPVTSVGTGATGVSVGTYPATLRGAATISSTAAASGSIVAVTFNDLTANVTGFVVLASNVNPTAANYTAIEPPAKNFNLAANITTGQHLSIRVQAENGTVWYHRIVVTVQ